MTYSADQLARLCGEISIKNISGGALQLTNYGQYTFAVDEEINLLDSALPDTLRAADYPNALNMVGCATPTKAPHHTDYELAQRIVANELAVTVNRRPDNSVVEEEHEG